MEISPMTFAAILAEKIGEPEIENIDTPHS